MGQLWIVMSGLALLNLAVFTVGVDVYEDYVADEPQEGVVEVYEVEEADAPVEEVIQQKEEAPAEIEQPST